MGLNGWDTWITIPHGKSTQDWGAAAAAKSTLTAQAAASDQSLEALIADRCATAEHPVSLAENLAQAAAWSRRFPLFGPGVAWPSVMCSAFTFNRPDHFFEDSWPTPNPSLFVVRRSDPNVNFHLAQQIARRHTPSTTYETDTVGRLELIANSTQACGRAAIWTYLNRLQVPTSPSCQVADHHRANASGSPR